MEYFACQRVKEGLNNAFLTWEEEGLLCAHYLRKLLEFCNLFQPPIPRAALVSCVFKTVITYAATYVYKFTGIEYQS